MQELLEILGIPYTGLGVARASAASDKVLAKHAMRDAGIPTPEFYAFTETAFKELGAAEALPAIEERLEFPIVVKPADQGSALGIKFARAPADVPRRSSPRSPTRRRCCSSATSTGATSRSRSSTASALPVVEAVPREEDFYDFEARYTIGRTSSSCPAELGDALTERAQALALEVFRLLGCAGFARVDLMLEAGTEALYVLEVNAIPGLTETSLLPQAAEAGGVASTS